MLLDATMRFILNRFNSYTLCPEIQLDVDYQSNSYLKSWSSWRPSYDYDALIVVLEPCSCREVSKNIIEFHPRNLSHKFSSI